MIVIPIQFIIALALGAIVVILLIIVRIAEWANKVIKKIRKIK